MTQDRLFAPSESTVANALIDNSGYQAMYDACLLYTSDAADDQ